MEARREGDFFLFNSVEYGRKGKTYYLCDKVFSTEAEAWLDATFSQVLINYGAARCLTILGGTSQVRHERNVRTTSRISAYLKNLNLSTTSVAVCKSNSTLSTPLSRHKKESPRIVYGDNTKSGWTQPIHKNSDSNTEIASAGETSTDNNKAVAPSEKVKDKWK